MNYLAHRLLSFEDEDLAIGNFIADSIVGNQFGYLPHRIQQGIQLHRTIDSFTDTHPVVKKSKRRLFAKYRHFSAVIVDMIYDHFLAAAWSKYSDCDLEKYIQDFYSLLDDRFEVLPAGVQQWYPFMVQDNWLFTYATVEGMGRILTQMSRRIRIPSGMEYAVQDLEEHYDVFSEEFHQFFPELMAESQRKIRELDLELKRAK